MVYEKKKNKASMALVFGNKKKKKDRNNIFLNGKTAYMGSMLLLLLLSCFSRVQLCVTP